VRKNCEERNAVFMGVGDLISLSSLFSIRPRRGGAPSPLRLAPELAPDGPGRRGNGWDGRPPVWVRSPAKADDVGDGGTTRHVMPRLTKPLLYR
jgi:hypothetical protein